MHLLLLHSAGHHPAKSPSTPTPLHRAALAGLSQPHAAGMRLAARLPRVVPPCRFQQSGPPARQPHVAPPSGIPRYAERETQWDTPTPHRQHCTVPFILLLLPSQPHNTSHLRQPNTYRRRTCDCTSLHTCSYQTTHPPGSISVEPTKRCPTFSPTASSRTVSIFVTLQRLARTHYITRASVLAQPLTSIERRTRHAEPLLLYTTMTRITPPHDPLTLPPLLISLLLHHLQTTVSGASTFALDSTLSVSKHLIFPPL
jgi:hypothetical protein